MRIRNIIYNTLILRRKCPPPLPRCNSVSYKDSHHFLTLPSLLLAASSRVGRVSLFLLVALALASCAKEPAASPSSQSSSPEEPLSPHPTWTDDSTNNFWS